MKNITKKEKELLRIIRNNPEIRFTDLKKILEISDPMLSKYVTKLKDENLVKFEKQGNTKLYTFNKSNKKISKSLAVSQALEETIFNHFYDEGSDQFNVRENSDFFDELGNMLSGIFVYSVLEGIKGNTSWTDEIDLDIIFDMITEQYFRSFLDSNLSKITKPMTRSIYKTSSSRWKKIKDNLAESEREGLEDFQDDLDLKYKNLFTMLGGEFMLWEEEV